MWGILKGNNHLIYKTAFLKLMKGINSVLTGQVNVARSIFIFPPVGMRGGDGPPSRGEGFPHRVHGP